MSRKITLLLMLVACLMATVTKKSTADITYGMYELGVYEAYGQDYAEADGQYECGSRHHRSQPASRRLDYGRSDRFMVMDQ